MKKKYNIKENIGGFTLIELLAVIVILGVIMVIAIPSMTSTIEGSKKDTMARTAQQYIRGANTLLLSNNELPTPGTGAIVYVNDIELNSGGTSPYDNKPFVNENSYVVVTNESGDYKYYVALQDQSGNCLKLVEEKVLGNKTKEVRQYVTAGTACGITSVSTNAPTTIAGIDDEVTYSIYKK